MSNEKIEISQGIRVIHWIFDGAPSQFGVQLSNKKIVPLKKVEWSFFHRIWLKLKMPAVFYHESDNSIEFDTLGYTKE